MKTSQAVTGIVLAVAILVVGLAIIRHAKFSALKNETFIMVDEDLITGEKKLERYQYDAAINALHSFDLETGLWLGSVMGQKPYDEDAALTIIVPQGIASIIRTKIPIPKLKPGESTEGTMQVGSYNSQGIKLLRILPLTASAERDGDMTIVEFRTTGPTEVVDRVAYKDNYFKPLYSEKSATHNGEKVAHDRIYRK
ncbi:MAG: hypothetical protein JWN37_479 [Candidatus Nomurabacteria bacterium]|nr:hypothetical protein [Candidatus Nomurabacteria bacterium]